METAMSSFAVIGRDRVQSVLIDAYEKVQDVVADAYVQHHSGQTVNPDSYFLRFPHAPQNRIIALLAHLNGDTKVSGIKWIASYPENIKRGLQRASAVLVLNDGETGFPIACIECGLISAVRTTLSAVIGLYHLNGRTRKIRSVGIIGAGFIARNLIDCFVKLRWQVDEFVLHDTEPGYAKALCAYTSNLLTTNARVAAHRDELLTTCDVIVTTTTAGEPYIESRELLAHNPIVLNISLRDFSAEIILGANNIVDDIEHCLKANTSPHLAYQKSGNKNFINGHFGDLLAGRVVLKADAPTIFSPFGLGVLDVAVGKFVYEELLRRGELDSHENFFGEQARW